MHHNEFLFLQKLNETYPSPLHHTTHTHMIIPPFYDTGSFNHTCTHQSHIYEGYTGRVIYYCSVCNFSKTKIDITVINQELTIVSGWSESLIVCGGL